VHHLREKIKLLEGRLKKYQSFNGTDYNIQKVLELAAVFFKDQGKRDSFDQTPSDL
jgi:hypothetical protein